MICLQDLNYVVSHMMELKFHLGGTCIRHELKWWQFQRNNHFSPCWITIGCLFAMMASQSMKWKLINTKNRNVRLGDCSLKGNTGRKYFWWMTSSTSSSYTGSVTNMHTFSRIPHPSSREVESYNLSAAAFWVPMNRQLMMSQAVSCRTAEYFPIFQHQRQNVTHILSVKNKTKTVGN